MYGGICTLKYYSSMQGVLHYATTTTKTSNFTKWSEFSMKFIYNAALSGCKIVRWTHT